MGGPPQPEPLAAGPAPALLRFGVFEMNLRSGELRRAGSPVKLQQQPFRVLAALARRTGELVTREELRHEVWGEQTVVDFEQGLNFCVKQVRAALGDQAETPRYVETLPRRGYRFIAPVEAVLGPLEDEAAPVAALARPALRARPLSRGAASLLAVLAAGLTLALVIGRQRSPARPPPSGRVKLAVLPFQNLGADPAQEYFAEGLTEEMIAQLGRLQPERLAVIARTSAMKYKEPARDIAAIRRDLGVDYVVEGSVRHAEDQVRITAKLIQASDQTQLWSDTYQRDLRDMLALQSEVARAVAAGIQLTLTPQTEARLAGVGRVDPVAYQLFLRGRSFWNQRDAQGLRRSIEYFEKAIARRPDYALAYVGIADAFIVLADQGNAPAVEALPRARAAAIKALDLDASLAEAQATLAMVRAVYDWDWQGAERGFRRAIELNPSYATGHHWYAHLLRALGRFEEALAETRRARELDPLSLIVNLNVGSALFYAGRYEEAAAQYRRTLELNPDWAPAHWGLGRTLRKLRRPQEALAAHEKAVAVSGGDVGYVCTLANALALEGRRAEAGALLAEVQRRARKQYVSPYDLALVHAGLGDVERALASLEQAYLERHSSLRQLRVDERLDPVRSDPRFEALARKLGLHPWPLIPDAARSAPR